MKTLNIFIASILIVVSQMAFAQHNGPHAKNPQANKEKIEAMKVSFITEKLSLTPEEAQKFWPVYNQFKAEMKEIKKAGKMPNGEARPNIETMTEKEAATFAEQRFITEQKALDIKKKYHEEFKKILPVKKVAQLYIAEEQFKRELLKQMRSEKP